MSTEIVRALVKPFAKTGEERRTELRYKFGAEVRLSEIGSAEMRAGLVSDLSVHGCYVDVSPCFPLGTLANIRIIKSDKSFEGCVRVVFSQAGSGMGLLFTSISTAGALIIETWISASRETSWLAANRRKSQRIFLQLPVRVSGPGGGLPAFEEDSHTVSISALGALVLLAAPVKKGQPVILRDVRTGSSVECIVTYIGEGEGDFSQVGMAFVLPNSDFWPVTFPPQNWKPDLEVAKSFTDPSGKS